MSKPRAVPLLYGPYTSPELDIGDYTECLVRDCLVIVTDWREARIPWPIGRRPGKAGGLGIIVTEELVRAVQRESCTAIMYWWGVSNFTVVKWRKALDANRQNNEGSQILIHAATTKARDVADQSGPTEQARQKHREHALRRRLWELAPRVSHGIEWTPEHIALLGTMRDREVAELTGHPYTSVKTTRLRLRIPCFGASE